MTGTRPAFGCGSLSFSVSRQGTVSTASPLWASAILLRQQNGLKRRSASAPARSYIVIVMRDSWVSNSSVVTSRAAARQRFRVARSSLEALGEFGEPDDKAAVPIEHSAAGIESNHLDVAHPRLLSPNCAHAQPAP
jgi:hypothetical protein